MKKKKAIENVTTWLENNLNIGDSLFVDINVASTPLTGMVDEVIHKNALDLKVRIDSEESS